MVVFWTRFRTPKGSEKGGLFRSQDETKVDAKTGSKSKRGEMALGPFRTTFLWFFYYFQEINFSEGPPKGTPKPPRIEAK